MLDFLNFTFANIWHFIGVAVLLGILSKFRLVSINVNNKNASKINKILDNLSEE